jgi:hypothetical protein
MIERMNQQKTFYENQIQTKDRELTTERETIQQLNQKITTLNSLFSKECDLKERLKRAKQENEKRQNTINKLQQQITQLNQQLAEQNSHEQQ